ncbi:hypothetical protein HHJ78_02475 [Mobiluncus mulieris]|uniref:Uncharacterized protein n=1 Tax=Mobiluncus mulieris TaxID=2052 RepID=A0A7Y0TZY7_9ACTO|nr:hypothetical protein [Mobiluncus mulieris]NMW64420.1 hypothetical protein [Mobiluncus mulieris]
MMGYTVRFPMRVNNDAKRKWFKKHFGVFDFTGWENKDTFFAKPLLRKDKAEELARTAREAGFAPVTVQYEEYPDCC